MRFQILLATLLLMLVLPTFGPAAAQATDDAAFNGEFELAAHQVRPALCELFGEGYINVFQPGNPYGLPWLVVLTACQSSSVKAAHWSSGMTTEFGDFDDDGDREGRFIAGSTDPNTGAGHNLWQAYPSPHQAYTGNFESYQFRVEHGEVPANAKIVLSLAAYPVANPLPSDALLIECQLSFAGALIQPGEDGLVSIDPTFGSFSSRHEACEPLTSAWNAASPGSDERREVLDGVRIIQNSFWSWNSGTDDVVIDGISLVGSRLFPQALLP